MKFPLAIEFEAAACCCSGARDHGRQSASPRPEERRDGRGGGRGKRRVTVARPNPSAFVCLRRWGGRREKEKAKKGKGEGRPAVANALIDDRRSAPRVVFLADHTNSAGGDDHQREQGTARAYSQFGVARPYFRLGNGAACQTAACTTSWASRRRPALGRSRKRTGKRRGCFTRISGRARRTRCESRRPQKCRSSLRLTRS